MESITTVCTTLRSSIFSSMGDKVFEVQPFLHSRKVLHKMCLPHISSVYSCFRSLCGLLPTTRSSHGTRNCMRIKFSFSHFYCFDHHFSLIRSLSLSIMLRLQQIDISFRSKVMSEFFSHRFIFLYSGHFCCC